MPTWSNITPRLPAAGVSYGWGAAGPDRRRTTSMMLVARDAEPLDAPLMHLVDLRRLGGDDRAGQPLHRPVLALRELDLRHPNRSLVVRDHDVEERAIERPSSPQYARAHVHAHLVRVQVEAAPRDAGIAQAPIEPLHLADLRVLRCNDRVGQLLDLRAVALALCEFGPLQGRPVVRHHLRDESAVDAVARDLESLDRGVVSRRSGRGAVLLAAARQPQRQR